MKIGWGRGCMLDACLYLRGFVSSLWACPLEPAWTLAGDRTVRLSLICLFVPLFQFSGHAPQNPHGHWLGGGASYLSLVYLCQLSEHATLDPHGDWLGSGLYA